MPRVYKQALALRSAMHAEGYGHMNHMPENENIKFLYSDLSSS